MTHFIWRNPSNSGSRLILSVLIPILLGACTTVPKDLGREEVRKVIDSALDDGQKTSQPQQLADLLSRPLDIDAAIQVALLNSADLKIAFAQLGFAAADLYEAGRIRNPIFSGAFLDSNQSGERDQITLELVLPLIDMLTLPARKRLGEAMFEIEKKKTAFAVLTLIRDVQQSYYQYVGAQNDQQFQQQITHAASLAARLGDRYFAAGNITALELAELQDKASSEKLLELQAQAVAAASRHELAAKLGLPAHGTWQISTELFLPVDQEDPLEPLIANAMTQRLDLNVERASVDVVAGRLGLTSWERWLHDAEIGYERERETDGAKLRGPVVSLQVPIISQHNDKLLRQQSELRIAALEYEKSRLAVMNDVRLAFASLQNARARLDEYQQQLMPARTQQVARMQEEVNFMLSGIFDLMELRQHEYRGAQAYFGALKDYWQTRSTLAYLSGASLPSAKAITQETIGVSDFLTTTEVGHHAAHGDLSRGEENAHDQQQLPAATGHQH